MRIRNLINNHIILKIIYYFTMQLALNRILENKVIYNEDVLNDYEASAFIIISAINLLLIIYEIVNI